METNVLKIDLDIKTKKKAIKHLRERWSYFHDIKFLDCEIIDQIVLVRKSTYGCKIYLKRSLEMSYLIIIVQLCLGSDWMKEVNTTLNHYKYNMEYSNRLFTVKRYRDGRLKFAKEYDVTKEILDYVYSDNRKKFSN